MWKRVVAVRPEQCRLLTWLRNSSLSVIDSSIRSAVRAVLGTLLMHTGVVAAEETTSAGRSENSEPSSPKLVRAESAELHPVTISVGQRGPQPL